MADRPAALDAAALRRTRGVDLTVWPPRYDLAYRPAPDAEHWLPEIECADPKVRDALIFAKPARQVRYAWEQSPFYRRKWQEAGVSPDTLKHLDDLALIEETFGGICVDMGSMAEMSPWMTNGECRHRTGTHLWQELVYTQVCDPETFRPVPYGAEGTPVYTHLERTSQPMIRLVSGDRARWVDEPCPCGRTYPRLPQGLYGRFDDMIIVRGENIYPSAIEDTLRAIDGFGGEFRIIVSRREAMDELLVRAEYTAGHQVRVDALRATMRERLRARLGVHPVVDLVPEGTLPRTEFKARRVIDDRDLYCRGLTR